MLLLLILVRTVTNIQCVGPLKLLSAREIIRISGVFYRSFSWDNPTCWVPEVVFENNSHFSGILFWPQISTF